MKKILLLAMAGLLTVSCIEYSEERLPVRAKLGSTRVIIQDGYTIYHEFRSKAGFTKTYWCTERVEYTPNRQPQDFFSEPLPAKWEED